MKRCPAVNWNTFRRWTTAVDLPCARWNPSSPLPTGAQPGRFKPRLSPQASGSPEPHVAARPGAPAQVLPSRGQSHEHKLAKQRPGQTDRGFNTLKWFHKYTPHFSILLQYSGECQRPAADHWALHWGEDWAQASVSEGHQPDWAQHHPDHCVRLLLCKCHQVSSVIELC